MPDPRPKTASSVKALASAKINLYLHVTGRRPDGYHLLDSLVVFADVGDWISVRRDQGPGISVTREGPFAGSLPTDVDDDLVAKAAGLILSAMGSAENGIGLKIHLTKNLPVASGIGGGSADAAATLRAVAACIDTDNNGEFDPLQFAELALDLGADVPVCLAGLPSLMRGIGEDLTPVVPLPRTAIVLVNPMVPISTPDVFRALGVQGESVRPIEPYPDAPFADAASLAGFLSDRDNDLFLPALNLLPELDRVLTALGATPGCLLARMSGSGATCFGLFDRLDDAATAATTIGNENPNWWVAAGSLLSEPSPLDFDRES
jgi:4-diphosphocytidyl-2-C-methyl-D-erythritol kinase